MSVATAVKVKNTGRKAVILSSAILSHFRFKKRGGSAIQGLRSCSYCSHPPLSSPFQILTPAEAMKPEDPVWLTFEAEAEPQGKKSGSWSHQSVPFTILENKMSRVYAAPPSERSKAFYNTPPSKYETIDQVRSSFNSLNPIQLKSIKTDQVIGLIKWNFGDTHLVIWVLGW